MLDYDTTMRTGQSRYQDVLDLLARSGLAATFTQTGGMNAALEVMLDDGHTLLITDAEDSLSWEPQERRGWGVGLFPPDRGNTDGECLAFHSTNDGSLEALVPTALGLLREYARHQRTGALGA